MPAAYAYPSPLGLTMETKKFVDFCNFVCKFRRDPASNYQTLLEVAWKLLSARLEVQMGLLGSIAGDLVIRTRLVCPQSSECAAASVSVELSLELSRVFVPQRSGEFHALPNRYDGLDTRPGGSLCVAFRAIEGARGELKMQEIFGKVQSFRRQYRQTQRRSCTLIEANGRA
jgi:hypothetical protein